MERNRMFALKYILCFFIIGISANIIDAVSRSLPKPSEYEEKTVSLPMTYSAVTKRLVNNVTVSSLTTYTPLCDGACPLSKRSRRVATLSKQLPSDNTGTNAQNVNVQAVLSPFPTLEPIREKKTSKNQRNKSGKGTRNNKPNGMRKNNSMASSEDSEKLHEGEKKGRKKILPKKPLTQPMREVQTSRRLRQHMQHKKKVKHHLQKRIQEQIEQRIQKQDSKLE